MQNKRANKPYWRHANDRDWEKSRFPSWGRNMDDWANPGENSDPAEVPLEWHASSDFSLGTVVYQLQSDFNLT